MKKPLVFLLVAVFLLFCSGCGAGGSTGRQSSSPALIKSVTLYGVDYETKE